MDLSSHCFFFFFLMEILKELEFESVGGFKCVALTRAEVFGAASNNSVR